MYKKTSIYISIAFILCLSVENINAQTEILIKGNQVLNKSADQLGVWLNTTIDEPNANMLEAFRLLNFKSLRYGWMYATLDKDDLSTQEFSPKDDDCQGYLTNNGRMNERFGPEGVATLLDSLEIPGFAVLNTDGVNYIGTQDAEIAAMTREEKLDFYIKKASDWADWANNNRFEFFEIGNENDISNEGEKNGVVKGWEPDEYAEVAHEYAKTLKEINPDAKCGITGGLRSDNEKVAKWFDDIYVAVPDINDNIDFISAHKYEFWLDYDNWKNHADWAFGKLGDGLLQSREKHFPNMPIHVTEIGSWKQEDSFKHYRAVLTTEMMGNLYSDSAVSHVQFWPTIWGEEGGLFYNSENYKLTPQGYGLLAYMKFAKPSLIANGNKDGIRYFASRNDEDELVVWLVNHNESDKALNFKIRDFNASIKNEQWRLVSATNDPQGQNTQLLREYQVEVEEENGATGFSTTLPPTSVTIIHFTPDAVFQEITGTGKIDSFPAIKVFPNPVKDKLFIESEQAFHYSFFNLQGKNVLQGKQKSGRMGIDISNLQAGIYQALIEQNKEVKQFKIVVD